MLWSVTDYRSSVPSPGYRWGVLTAEFHEEIVDSVDPLDIEAE